MSRMFITSVKGPSKLKLGYPVLSDKYNAIPFTLSADTPTPVLIGTAVMTTDTQGVYATVKDSGVVVTADNVNKVVGFILGNNATIPSVYPADGPDTLSAGMSGACCVDGAIAVKFSGTTDPAEEDKVFIVTASTDSDYVVGDITDGTTVANVTKIQLAGWRFMGISDTDEGFAVTAIHKGY